MKLSSCLFFLSTLTLISALNINIVINGRSYSTPLKGYWKFLEYTEGDESICCPFENLKMKVGDPDEYDDIHMIGSFNFAPELESRCMKGRFENYAKDMDIIAAGRGYYGYTNLKYKDSRGYDDTTYFTIQPDSRNDSIINLDYKDYLYGRGSVDCKYKMVKDDASSLIELWKRAEVWKICLMVAVLIVGLGLACQKNVYKVTPMEVQEEDGIQKYQAPEQYIQQQQQPDNVL